MTPHNTINRSISWGGTISEELAKKGPLSFPIRRLKKQEHLFAHRSALFYTPTENIPAEYIGCGPLDVMLPVASPDYTDLSEIHAYGSPRLWVDLIQRQTGKLRWTSMSPARVICTRYDNFIIRYDHLAMGMKGLIDALKLRTTGRRDRLYLYYFGAIFDDGPNFIDITWEQKIVAHSKEAGVRIQVAQDGPDIKH